MSEEMNNKILKAVQVLGQQGQAKDQRKEFLSNIRSICQEAGMQALTEGKPVLQINGTLEATVEKLLKEIKDDKDLSTNDDIGVSLMYIVIASSQEDKENDLVFPVIKGLVDCAIAMNNADVQVNPNLCLNAASILGGRLVKYKMPNKDGADLLQYLLTALPPASSFNLETSGRNRVFNSFVKKIKSENLIDMSSSAQNQELSALIKPILADYQKAKSDVGEREENNSSDQNVFSETSDNLRLFLS